MKQLYETFVNEGVQLSVMTLVESAEMLINGRDELIKSVPRGRSDKLYYLVPYPTGHERIISYLNALTDQPESSTGQTHVRWMIAFDAHGEFLRKPHRYGTSALLWTDNIHLAALLYHLYLNDNQSK